ncbi:MAG: hypothetical protein GX624_11140 [Actinobacteria bacterium]|nr:hypothetical protein [Actinomycetota bacterium]
MFTSPQRPSQRARAARFSRRPPSFAATLVALAVVFAVAWMLFLRSDEPVTAPLVDGVQGTYQWRSTAAGGETGVDGEFSAVRSGDAGGSARTPAGPGAPGLVPVRSAYATATRTESTCAGVGARLRCRRTVGQWPPVWRVATRSPLDYQGLAAIVRTAVEDGDDTVGIKPGKDADRAVWRASMRLDRQVDVVVDQETGLVTWYSSGGETFTADIDWDSPPQTAAAHDADAAAGAGAEVVTSAPQYAATPVDAGRDAGYDVLVSDLAPDGYELRAVATVPAGSLSRVDDGPWDLPDDSQGTGVLELYTRGLSLFTVEQVGSATMERLSGMPAQQEAAANGRLSVRETTLGYGAFAGETALTWYQESGPSLFVVGERRAVFVTGGLTRQELLAFAEGLKPVPRAQ